MTDYERKRFDAWLEYKDAGHPFGAPIQDIYFDAFNRGYELGMQDGAKDDAKSDTKDDTKSDTKEPKYKVGQEVYANGVKFPLKITHISYKEGEPYIYTLIGLGNTYTEEELSPADWQESNVNVSQVIENCDNLDKNPQTCTNICPSRLQVAAMIEPALINNPDLWKRLGNYYAGPGKETKYSFAKLALEYADALIKEFESSTQKGGRQC